jgi:uncharacterized protein YfaS (alpha-2-macroglobulin family)
MRWKPLLLFLLFAEILPARGQRPGGYFSISTNKTFLPGEKVGVRVFSTGVDALEFRVYRIKDPVAFIERLDDPHQFGHVSPREQIEAPSLLERFHDWKYGCWIEIRDFFRYQFSDRSRAAIREWQGRAHKGKIASAAIFAQAPVLNSSQLVARWRQQMPLSFFSETETVPVNALPKGVYLVEATDGALRAYTILVVSKMGLITKAAPGQILAFTADRRSGVPVAQADVRVWFDKNEHTHLQSDADGLAESPLASGKYEDVRVLAVHGDDVALVTPYSYSLSSDPSQDWTGYVYSDRPVYRPGDTVHFKAILRTRSGEALKVPAGRQVQVLIEDSASKPLLQSNFSVSSFGTIHGELTLPAAAALGYDSISVRSPAGDRYDANGDFYVEEYKKPEYEVKVRPAKQFVLQGDSVDATIEARYYYGEPVAGAEVKYVVHTSTYYSPFVDRNEDSDFASVQSGDSANSEEDDYAGDQISEQSGRLDADGKLKISIPTRLDKHHDDVRYRIEARVTDAANREISGRNSVIATYGSFQVGISAESYVYAKGQTIRATAMAKDYDGHVVPTAVRIELVKVSFGGSKQTEVVTASEDARTAAAGSTPVSFTATDTGSFLLRVTAQTPENREVRGTAWLWISSPNEAWGGASREIRMIADKKSYKVGDIAHVLILTGVPESYLLVTTEARTIETQRIVHATSSSVTVDVPIGSEQQPNVFVGAAFFHNNNLYQSTRNLSVPADEKELQIDIKPSTQQFEPGQKASYTVLVHDADGKPVVCELSLGIVDEAIYAIHPDNSGDLLDSFYGTVYDRVSTDSSLSFYFTGQAGKRGMLLAQRGFTNPRALAQLKPENLAMPKVRKVFPDTALWLADLHTDSSGRAEAQLEFPDSLTTWRATVRGVTADTKVGNAINKVIVRKNLIVRLAVPRFFRQGDEVNVSAIVQNYLPAAKNVQVSLDLKGLGVLSGSAGQIEVPSKGTAKRDWRVRAENVRQATLQTRALTNEESDAMEVTLPVIPVGVKLTDPKSGSISAANQEDIAIVTLPGSPETSAPSLDITLNSSIAGSIFGALGYLTSYPYGCTEQTMSSFLPNIVVAKALKDLKIQTSLNTPELEEKIRDGMARLKDYEHDDGGWGWWKDDDSQVFMTAYVVSGLNQVHAAGYDFDSHSLARAESWLHSQIQQHPRMRSDLRAYSVYALALNSRASVDELRAVWRDRDSMSTQGLAMVGLAMQATGDADKALQVARKLESTATVNDREAYWPSDYDYFLEFAGDDNAETTAYAVRFLSLVKPDSPLLPKAAFWLAAHRDGGYFWESTKQTAMVVFGLTEYLKASHELESNFTATVSVNGKPVFTKQFTPADAFNPAQPSIHLDAGQLLTGRNEIRIRKSGAGHLYWSATGAYYSADKRLYQHNKLSLNITRDYFRLSPEQVDGKIVYRLDPLSGSLHVGDILAVRVTLGGSEWRYLLMEDPIPAGTEFIQREDLYELKNPPDWWKSSYTRREFHDDRAAIFQDYFSGRREYTYLLKVVNPGKFQVSPAMVQPMYLPSVMATSDAATVEVQ